MSTRVRDISEFALIDRLLAALPEAVRGADAIGGQADDAAWWRNELGQSVVSTDALVEGVHFRLDWTDWESLGHKMLAVNLSDLASMGCRPTFVLVTLALTGDELVSDLESLYRGAGALAEIYGVSIVGGDVVRSPSSLMMSITAFGHQPEGVPLMTRSHAQPGDIVMVSGTLGASAAGLRILKEGGSQATTAHLLVGAHLRPAPRVSLGRALVAAGVRCCMDLSDGLSGDLPKILHASEVGASIDVEQLPVLPAVRALFPIDWQELAWFGGEDYELLCTVPPHLVEDVQSAAQGVGATLTAIGSVTDGKSLQVHRNGVPLESKAGRSWDHFGNGHG